VITGDSALGEVAAIPRVADIPVGASLLAIGPYQSTSTLNVQTPSRAGSLPQGNAVPAGLRAFVELIRKVFGRKTIK
jgi:hypothetical protein